MRFGTSLLARFTLARFVLFQKLPSAMSYPSIGRIADDKGVDLQSADQPQIDSVFLEAFREDLDKGFTYLENLVSEVREKSGRILKVEDPNSELGKQLIRLLGTDVARDILSRHFEVEFGLYNCCAPVCAPSADLLNMSPDEQLKLQNGALASADC